MAKEQTRAEARVTEGGRPNFPAIIAALENEAQWIAQLHGEGGRGDRDALLALASRVETVAKRLGYM